MVLLFLAFGLKREGIYEKNTQCKDLCVVIHIELALEDVAIQTTLRP